MGTYFWGYSDAHVHPVGSPGEVSQLVGAEAEVLSGDVCKKPSEFLWSCLSRQQLEQKTAGA